MKMSKDSELWLYGSEARGDVDDISDRDLLFVGDGEITEKDIPQESRDLLAISTVSRYDWNEIEGMAKYGSLFLHHLRLEGRFLASSKTCTLSLRTILNQLPPYQRVNSDVRAFHTTVEDIRESLEYGGSPIFELSVLATVIRHASILGCYISGHPTFGRLRAVETVVDLWNLDPWIKMSFAELYAYRLFADRRLATIPKYLSDEEAVGWLQAAESVLGSLEEYADGYDRGLSQAS
jgi:hypothetical protein